MEEGNLSDNLEKIVKGCSLKGVIPGQTVTVIDVRQRGSAAIELTYRDAAGRADTTLLFQGQDTGIEIEAPGVNWAFDASGEDFKLAAEAHRIRLAHLFDPMLAVHTSRLIPLPHQITAVYGEMLKRQPLKFLLADDPGAGKTIMTGLLIKELVIRGDLERCLIVCPGSLVDQWQDELWERFRLDFDILTRVDVESSRDADPFRGKNLLIARLDMMSRDEELQDKLKKEAESGPGWDLVVCDEAHKMSAHFFGQEVKATKRYRLGQLLSGVTRHFLLLTATPHSGKDDDFQLFMALLDQDRFATHPKASRKAGDVGDLMRRLTKERLYKFDGTPLFPARMAYSVKYELSKEEMDLYELVSAYVREEMNRAERLVAEGDKRRGNMVGFALTVLQRRLASSPEAILRSLERRRKRLEKRLEEAQKQREDALPLAADPAEVDFTDEDFEADIDEASDEEAEAIEDQVLDKATAAKTIKELGKEIESLKKLESAAAAVRASGKDRKWEQLSSVLQDIPEMFDQSGARRKLIIFSEHRDTVHYLAARVQELLGRKEAIAVIHGGLKREDRKRTQDAFTNDKGVLILVATDAAGEGINLQRAHLMINYDLPWNPNRLEQRFGRIHRIGQEEICHLWNLVAEGTREGAVFSRLLEKLQAEGNALDGQVFDILGKLFVEESLRDLLIAAVRHGDDPAEKAKIFKKLDCATDLEHVKKIWAENALTGETLDPAMVIKIREEMERMEARRLQPNFISLFFKQAFAALGGTMRLREPQRYEITHIPAEIRRRESKVVQRYERVTFHKEGIQIPGKPLAEFLCPGQPLLNAVISLTLERSGSSLLRGAVLVDKDDPGTAPRLLFTLKSTIHDSRLTRSGEKRTISERLEFVEIARGGKPKLAGPAPYLDYDPLEPELRDLVMKKLSELLPTSNPAEAAEDHAICSLVPQHLEEVKNYRLPLAEKTMLAVKDRLTREIQYWDQKTNEMKEKELAGKKTGMGSGRARQRADELELRRDRRLAELELEKNITSRPPVILGGALIIPAGMLTQIQGKPDPEADKFAEEKDEIERLAMAAVMESERRVGRVPRDVSDQNAGWDIESSIPGTGKLVFIEVKGRKAGARTVTITKNEILAGLNKPDDFVLAVVEVVNGTPKQPQYVRRPFEGEPDSQAASINYELKKLLAKAVPLCP